MTMLTNIVRVDHFICVKNCRFTSIISCSVSPATNRSLSTHVNCCIVYDFMSFSDLLENGHYWKMMVQKLRRLWVMLMRPQQAGTNWISSSNKISWSLIITTAWLLKLDMKVAKHNHTTCESWPLAVFLTVAIALWVGESPVDMKISHCIKGIGGSRAKNIYFFCFDTCYSTIFLLSKMGS